MVWLRRHIYPWPPPVIVQYSRYELEDIYDDNVDEVHFNHYSSNYGNASMLETARRIHEFGM
jgi:hypothetical protein